MEKKNKFRRYIKKLNKIFGKTETINENEENLSTTENGQEIWAENWEEEPTPPQAKVPKPVALFLIVPASEVRNLKENIQVNHFEVEALIDKSLYFLCTSLEDINAIEQPLELTNEDITTVSEQREVYIIIEISDGEEMIDKKVPYILKRNLAHDGEYFVEKLACLKYLSVSGLEKFNRI